MATSCNFTADIPPGTILDPRKRVRHFTGLVMGEEEFRQDQFYFMSRDELHQRALHGYGVVSGLGVSVRPNDTSGNPEVVVAAGLAVNPRGESICVPIAQCGDLNEWLENNRDELLGSPPALLPASVPLYLVLCARDCETDEVPVLGDPCRTLEDTTAASRIADDFELCLRLEPPQQLEEEAARELGKLLRSIEISDAGAGLSPEELADLVRDLLPSGSPPQVGQIEPGAGSPPVTLRLHPDDVTEALTAAYRVWIREVRPALNPETGACEVPRDSDDGRCVLLACLEVGYDDGADGLEVIGDIGIDNNCGPVLLQTRLLQEMLLAGLCCPAVTPAPESPATDGTSEAGGSSPMLGPFEPDLSRIIALSWEHSGRTLLQITHDGTPVFGLAVGFGTALGVQTPVLASTLNNNTFRVFLRLDSRPDTRLAIFQTAELQPQAVLAVNVVSANGLIVETRSTTNDDEINGVLFQIDDRTAEELISQRQQLFIELAGDHMRDANGRAIDAEFPRSGLPSGDGPGNAELGIQGGRFESWVTTGRAP